MKIKKYYTIKSSINKIDFQQLFQNNQQEIVLFRQLNQNKSIFLNIVQCQIVRSQITFTNNFSNLID